MPAYRSQVINVRNERGHIALGLIYSMLQDKPHAREQVRFALEINPNNPWTLFFSSEIEAELGDDRQAIAQASLAVAQGFLSQHYFDWPPGPLYRLRSHPDIRTLRRALSLHIATLRKQY